METGQEEKAGLVKENERDYLGAIALYLKGGLPARAAQVSSSAATLALLSPGQPPSSSARDGLLTSGPVELRSTPVVLLGCLLGSLQRRWSCRTM